MSFARNDEDRGHFWLCTGSALIFYVALTIVVTWPLVVVLGSRVPHDLGDPLLSLWTLWWSAQHVPFTPTWWNAPQFYPSAGSIALSDHRVGIALLSLPLQWLGASPLATYNIALLASFPLSALAAHVLVFALTRRADAALVSGLAFGFSPYRIAHIEHLELVSSYWMPIALLALHQYIKRPAPQFAALFCLAWLLQSLCSSYYLFFFSVFVSLWLLWFLPSSVGWKYAIMLLLSWLAAGLLLVPVLLTYRDVQESFGVVRTLREIEYYSADVTAVLSASPLLAVWRSSLRFEHPEGQLFPGAFALAVVVAALIFSCTRERVQDVAWARRFRSLVLTLTVIALTAAWLAPWKFAIGAIKASASTPRKPLSIALALMVVYGVLHPRVRAGYRERSLFAFYAIAALISWTLTWGPAPKFLGYPFLYQAPYTWLMRLPGFSSGLRVPARFAMPAVLALSVAAGLAFARLVSSATSRVVRAACLSLIAAGIAADGWIKELPLLPPPASWALPLPSSEFAAVLELPVKADSNVDAAAVYRSLGHTRPTINGFSGYLPPHYRPLQLCLESGDERALAVLALWGPILIAIDHQNDPNGAWVQYVSRHTGVRPAGASGTWSFFLLPATPPEPPLAMTGTELRPQRITSNFSSANAGYLTDNDPFTRWSTAGPQRGTEQVLIDLGAAKELSGVVLSLGPYTVDFPRLLSIDTSLDGQSWTTAWSGTTAALALAAALDDPHNTTMRFQFNSPSARFVRLRQTQADGTYFWSIARVAVFGMAVSTQGSRVSSLPRFEPNNEDGLPAAVTRPASSTTT